MVGDVMVQLEVAVISAVPLAVALRLAQSTVTSEDDVIDILESAFKDITADPSSFLICVAVALYEGTLFGKEDNPTIAVASDRL
jgi:hypothetical protein